MMMLRVRFIAYWLSGKWPQCCAALFSTRTCSLGTMDSGLLGTRDASKPCFQTLLLAVPRNQQSLSPRRKRTTLQRLLASPPSITMILHS